MQKKPAKPRFCVFCGIAFPAGVQVTRCPGCGAEIPEQYRPVQRHARFGGPASADVDKSISYCIYCGEFLVKASFFTGTCPRCHKDLPRAPPSGP
nr:hypothetical protein [Candidatus Sigynarchaeum springense]